MSSVRRPSRVHLLISIGSALCRYYSTWAALGIIIAAIPFALSLWLIWPSLINPTWLEWIVLGAIFLFALPLIFCFCFFGNVAWCPAGHLETSARQRLWALHR